MSGRRQHGIPVHLQKYFTDSDGFVTVNFCNSPGSDKRRPARVAVSSWFYSPAYNPELDDIITKREEKYSLILDLIHKSGASSLQQHAAILSEMVIHYWLRTDHARKWMASASDQKLKSLSQQEKMQVVRNPDYTVEQAREYVSRGKRGQKFNETQEMWAQVVHRLGNKLVRQNEDALQARAATAEDPPGGDKVQQSLLSNFHKNEGFLAPILRHLGKFEWYAIETAPGEEFVLPDCVVLFADNEHGIYSMTLMDIRTTANVIFPIGVHKLIIGRATDAFVVPPVESINEAAIEISDTFWITRPIRSRGTMRSEEQASEIEGNKYRAVSETKPKR